MKVATDAELLDSYSRTITGVVGQTVYYRMVVTNTGNTPLDITLSDPLCDSGTLTPTGSASLAPGASADYYCSHVLTTSDIPQFVNTATAHGQSANASSSVSASSKVTANVGAVKGDLGEAVLGHLDGAPRLLHLPAQLLHVGNGEAGIVSHHQDVCRLEDPA